jgi:hypothetical protein
LEKLIMASTESNLPAVNVAYVEQFSTVYMASKMAEFFNSVTQERRISGIND